MSHPGSLYLSGAFCFFDNYIIVFHRKFYSKKGVNNKKNRSDEALFPGKNLLFSGQQ